ncbi:50S ribosomal protein L29 [Buchnera aphidicola (Thelaxes californica)]|uniref:Large ribosomal subunit protein uL29 n=1 Tax=Buchnera aphidicola (Thelaxes californica) TaxID=1315998 RepID=A0A4D6YC46_9GAMM|nr:50S ribosomal protein L29 [Buchnera aphidicola]QCI26919.1 50S ribosomal protein L29 [Buchnera aphidicola (Thelaxes californica)]
MNLIKENINIAELKKNLSDYLREQFNLKMQLSSGKLKQTHLIKKVRKKIAFIHTMITKTRKNNHNE